jgi:hypothetical protein
MILKMSLIITLTTFFSAAFDKCNCNQTGHRITVVGTALNMKYFAAVKTDDGRFYYLDGLEEWSDEYWGKRVKVTGKLILKEYSKEVKMGDDSVSTIPQQKLGTWKILMQPKWSLVE